MNDEIMDLKEIIDLNGTVLDLRMYSHYKHADKVGKVKYAKLLGNLIAFKFLSGETTISREEILDLGNDCG